MDSEKKNHGKLPSPEEITITTKHEEPRRQYKEEETNHQPTCQSPSYSDLSIGTKSDSAFRPVLRDVSNLNPTLPSSRSTQRFTQRFTQPSTGFSSGFRKYILWCSFRSFLVLS